MNIFIMRHGSAEPMAPDCCDRDRALTLSGREQVTRTAYWMNRHQHFPLRVISSPFVRTRQTAEIMVEDLHLTCPVEYSDDLISGSDPRRFMDYLMTLDEASILLTSHMPLVAELTLLLAPGAALEKFSTASVAKIRYDKNSMHGQLTAHVAPEQI